MAILDPDHQEGSGTSEPATKVYPPRSGRPNRGSRKQVFVCGVA